MDRFSLRIVMMVHMIKGFSAATQYVYGSANDCHLIWLGLTLRNIHGKVYVLFIAQYNYQKGGADIILSELVQDYVRTPISGICTCKKHMMNWSSNVILALTWMPSVNRWEGLLTGCRTSYSGRMDMRQCFTVTGKPPVPTLNPWKTVKYHIRVFKDF